jgi:transcriptional regulator with XRE-family HTH domain
MNIGKSIKELRTKKGYNQKDFAALCNISQTAISQIENGVSQPSKTTLKTICKQLEVPETILYLYGMDESDIPENKKELYAILYPAIHDMIGKLVV